jgi:hypothetical protein
MQRRIFEASFKPSRKESDQLVMSGMHTGGGKMARIASICHPCVDTFKKTIKQKGY